MSSPTWTVTAATNRRLVRFIVALGAIAACLVLVLPESTALSSLEIVQLLGRLTPSAGKSAAVSALPNVVALFLTLILWIAPLLAIFFIVRHESLDARATHARSREPSLLKLVLKSTAASLVLLGLIAFLYLLPGTARADFALNRGQMFFSLMVGSRLGLMVLGPLVAMSAFCLWWALLLALAVTTKCLAASTGDRYE